MDFEKDLKLIRYVFTVTVLALLLMVCFNSVRATYDPKITANSKNIRSGSVALLNTDLTKAVTFSSALSSANYSVFIERNGTTLSIMYPASKTTSGFTLTIGVGVTETVRYLAVED